MKKSSSSSSSYFYDFRNTLYSTSLGAFGSEVGPGSSDKIGALRVAWKRVGVGNM